MEMHDGEAGKRGGVWVKNAAAETGHTLHWHAVAAGLGRRHGNDYRQRFLELVDPLDPDRMPALGLDRRPRHSPSNPQILESARSR